MIANTTFDLGLALVGPRKHVSIGLAAFATGLANFVATRALKLAADFNQTAPAHRARRPLRRFVGRRWRSRQRLILGALGRAVVRELHSLPN
jgi:hypothetical protein